MNDTFNTAVNIESVHGARTPKWYTLDIVFDGGETQAKSRAFEISSEGAFIPTALQGYFKYTSDTGSDYTFGSFNPVRTPKGRYVPLSTFPIFGDGILNNVIFVARQPLPQKYSKLIYSNSQCMTFQSLVLALS